MKLIQEELSTQNLDALIPMVLKLWPDCQYKEEYRNYDALINSEKNACYLLRNEERYIGFIHLSLRTDYVEGTSSSPVAYIEGIFVEPEYRRSGVGQDLVTVGEVWGKSKGCTEYASDVVLGNDTSIDFHKSAGFREESRVVCFVKDIS